MNELVRALRVCAFCPNTCRDHWPGQAGVGPESRTPSAMALLGLAVAEGRWPADAATRQALAQREMVHALRPHCDHHLDVAGLLDAALQAASGGATGLPGAGTVEPAR